MAYDSKAIQEDLAAWMTEATKRIQVESRFVEDGLFRPLWSRYRAFAELNPATTLFLTALACLSVFPLTIFFAFATLVVSSLMFFALGGVAFFGFWIVAAALGVLLLVLAVAGAMSSLITLVSFNTFVLYRLIVHVTGPDGSSKGFFNWIAETQSRFGVPRQPPVSSYSDRQPKNGVVF